MRPARTRPAAAAAGFVCAEDGMDYLSRSGAQELARMIERYWHDRGFRAVRARVERFGENGCTLYAVRSNLVGGNPPIGYAEAA